MNIYINFQIYIFPSIILQNVYLHNKSVWKREIFFKQLKNDRNISLKNLVTRWSHLIKEIE